MARLRNLIIKQIFFNFLLKSLNSLSFPIGRGAGLGGSKHDLNHVFMQNLQLFL